MRPIALGLLLVADIACAARTPATMPSLGHAAYIVRLGIDTIMVERFSVSHGVIEGDLVDRSPTTSLSHYRIAIDEAGHIVQFHATQRAAPGAPATPVFHTTIDRAADGFDVVLQEGDSTQRRHVRADANAVPLFGRLIGLDEIVTTRLRRAGVDSISVPVLDLAEFSVTDRVVATLGPDSVLLRLLFPRGEHARVDAAGHILGVSGLATSYKWLTEQTTDVDIGALAHSFAERDARGSSLGNYSARDTARAIVGGARITIDYGRPSKRGRVIFGGLVPWGEVWRTGADLATHFTTDHALRVNGLVVPAGTYTLYTLPSPTTWQLIVNRQTGQLGLLYDPASDLGRVAMMTTTAPDVTERLTITIDAAPAGGGLLRLAWDRLVATVSFEIAPDASPTPRRL